MILFFLIFSKSFFFPAFLSMIIEIVSKGNKTKTCFNKSFGIIILNILHICVLLAFTVLRFLSIYLLTPKNFEFLG